MQKPPTPNTDKLNAMPPGVARDLFAQINRNALQMESGQVQDFERAADAGRAEDRVELARKAGCPELARYRELEQSQPLMATIYRSSNSFALAQQERKLEALETPPDEGPQAA